MKQCTKCLLSFPENVYYSNGKQKKSSICPTCSVKRHREWVNKNRKRHQEYQRNYYHKNPHNAYLSNMKRIYGLSKEQIEYLLEHAKCAICGKPGNDRKLVMDHNHKTGENRDFLCNGCNTGIGAFAEDIISLSNAIEYLIKHNRENLENTK